MPILNRYLYSHQIDLIINSEINSDAFTLGLSLYSKSEQSNLAITKKLADSDMSIMKMILEANLNTKQWLDKNSPYIEGNTLIPNNAYSYFLMSMLIKSRMHIAHSNIKKHIEMLNTSIELAYIRLANTEYLEENKDNICHFKKEVILEASSYFGLSDWVKGISSPHFPIFLRSMTNTALVQDAFRFSSYTLDDLFDISKYRNSVKSISQTMGLNKFNIEFLPLGNFSIITIDNLPYICSIEIINRLSDLINEFGKIAMIYDICDPMISDVKEFTNVIVNHIISLSRYDPEFVGESIKAARNLMITKLDSSDLMGIKLFDLLKDEYDYNKLTLAYRTIEVIISMFRSTRHQITFSHIYKVVMHPDVDMISAFTKLEGLYEPNEVKDDLFNIYKGVLRRAIFDSLVKSKKNPRIREGPLKEYAAESEYHYSKLINASAIEWSETILSPIMSLPKFNEMEVKVSNKSSAPPGIFEYSDFLYMKNSRNHSTTKYPKEKLLKAFLSINDAEVSLRGESKLTAKSSRDRIMEIKRLHDNFCINYIPLSPISIPVSNYIDFYKMNPRAFHIVGTEPKLGEKHKKETRMFYMAQQEIKAFTQRVERLARNISRHQKGVSITKSSASRDRDISSFVNSMKYQAGDPDYCFYISFDMSSFSMKFPVKLLDDYGSLLTELTGDPIYLNLGLIFRSAIVYNNTRESFDFLISPKGGFEGFYNFVWTSIHAAILETALMKTGLPGEVLTYSDDGILKIYFKDIAGKTPMQVVNTIKQTYSSLGLEFNIGKTFVSPMIWEYLGKVCYNGSIMRSYTKELASMGEEDQTRSFNPVSLRLSSICGQARALCTAGMSSYYSSIFCNYYTSRLINKISFTLPVSMYKYILIMPESVGGLRTPSVIELGASGDVSSFAEFLADLELVAVTDRKAINRLVNYIKDNLSKMDVVSICLRKCWVGVSGRDNSSRANLLAILDKAKESMEVIIPQDPLDDYSKTRLNAIMQQVDNLNPDILGDLIRSIPSVREYEDAISMTKSQAIFRLVKRGFIQSKQARDTRIVRNNINNICDIASGSIAGTDDTYSNPYSIFDSINDSIGGNLAIIRPSIRVIFSSKEKENYTIIRTSYPTDTSPVSSRSSYDFDYLETYTMTKYRDIDLTWDAEAFGYSEDFYLRQFSNKLLTLISMDESLWGFAADLAAFFNVRLVLTWCFNKLNRSLYRRRISKGKNLDINYSAPQGIKEITNIFNSPLIYYKADFNVSNDLSTYPALATALHISHISTIPPKLGSSLFTTYRYSGICIEHLIAPKHMTSKDYVRKFESMDFKRNDEEPNKVEESIVAAIEDIKHEDALVELLADFPGYDPENNAIGNSFLENFQIHVLKDYIDSCLAGPTYRILVDKPKLPIKVNVRINLLVDTILESVFDKYPTAQLLMVYNEFNELMYGDLSDCLRVKEFGIISYYKDILNLLTRDYAIVFPDSVSTTIMSIEFVKEKLHNYIYGKDIFNLAHQIVVVINDVPSSINSSVAIHRIVSNLYKNQLSMIRRELRETDWSIDAIPAQLRETFEYDVDIALDVFSITCSILRYSDHRHVLYAPFNYNMAAVMLLEIWALTNYLFSYGDFLDNAPETLIYNLINHTLGKAGERGTYMLDYAYNMYIDDLYGQIMRLFGPDHWHRASETLYPSVVKRVIDRFNNKRREPSASAYTSMIGIAQNYCVRFGKVVGKALSQKLDIKYIPSSIREKLIENQLRPDISNIIIHYSYIALPDEPRDFSILSDKSNQFKMLFLLKNLVNEAQMMNKIPSLSTKFLDKTLASLLRKQKGSIDCYYNEFVPNLVNILSFKANSFRESLFYYKIYEQCNKGLCKIYKIEIDYYLVLSIGFLSQHHNLILRKEYSYIRDNFSDQDANLVNNNSIEVDYVSPDFRDLDKPTYESKIDNGNDKSEYHVSLINDLSYLEIVLCNDSDDIDIAIQEDRKVEEQIEDRISEAIKTKKAEDAEVYAPRSLKRVIVPEIINDEPLLALSSSLMRAPFISGQMSQIYSYLLIYVDRILRIEGISFVPSLSEVMTIFNTKLAELMHMLTGNPRETRRVREDIAYVTAWISRHPVESDHSLYKAIRTQLLRLPKIVIQNTIPKSEYYGKTLSIKDYIKAPLSPDFKGIGDLFSEVINEDEVANDRKTIVDFMRQITLPANMGTNSGNLISEDDKKDDDDNEVKDYGNEITDDKILEMDMDTIIVLILEGKLKPKRIGKDMFMSIEEYAFSSNFADQWEAVCLDFDLSWDA